MLKITNLKSAKKVNINLEAYIMLQSKDIELINLTLKPGEILANHNNPFDVIFYVLRGTGIFTIDNQETEIIENSCFEVKTGIERGWKNNSSKNLNLLVIKKLN
jgi:quercetin dioxygenase-like cupin family protein